MLCGILTLRKIYAVLTALILLWACRDGVQAQDIASNYPAQPVRIIVGFTAGGGTDILARLIGQKLSEAWHQPVIIENKPGAGAIVATDYVAKATPDGYTLLMGASGAMAINPATYAKLPYSSQRDFVPISMVASFPLMLVVNAKSPIKTVQELIAFAKANPDKSNYASSSTAFQLATELFKMKSGAPMEPITYRGSGDSLIAVISGNVLATIADTIPVAPQLAGGQVRALAVTSPQRMTEYPDIPTMAEAGVAGVDVQLWAGLFAPAGTPPAIVNKVQSEIARIVKLPEVRARMRDLAIDPVGNTSDEFARMLTADIARWTVVAKAANIKIAP